MLDLGARRRIQINLGSWRIRRKPQPQPTPLHHHLCFVGSVCPSTPSLPPFDAICSLLRGRRSPPFNAIALFIRRHCSLLQRHRFSTPSAPRFNAIHLSLQRHPRLPSKPLTPPFDAIVFPLTPLVSSLRRHWILPSTPSVFETSAAYPIRYGRRLIFSIRIPS